MKKTVTINLNGLIYNIDEDAFAVLSSYIEQLKQYFEKLEEGDEIIKDIEARISELFSEKISQTRQVINIGDVEEVISILGNVHDIIDNDSADPSYSEKGFQNQEQKTRRKLYRDVDRRILGGVCAGLSAYTGISLLAVRTIIVVLFLISAGTFLLLYFLSWIIIPKAVTRAEKLEMKGEEVNISNLGKNIHREYNEVKENVKNMAKSASFGDNLERFGKALAGTINIIFKAVGKVFGLGLIFFGVIMIVSFLLGAFAFNSKVLIYDVMGITVVPFQGILKLIADPSIVFVLLVGFAFSFCIPLIALVYAGICIVLNKRSNRLLNISLLISWIVGIVLTVGLALTISADFMSTRTIRTSQLIECDSISCDTIYIDAIDNGSFDLESEDLMFDKLHLYQLNGEINAKGRVELEIRQSKDSTFSVEQVNSSRGSNRSEALDFVNEIEYHYYVENNQIILNRYFQLPNDFKIRGQKVRIICYVPKGKHVFLGSELQELIDDTDNLNNLDDDEMVNCVWTMTDQGLVLVGN
jgi:phage shock protein PspC (stress-responsive transcriptional regulator)